MMETCLFYVFIAIIWKLNGQVTFVWIATK